MTVKGQIWTPGREFSITDDIQGGCRGGSKAGEGEYDTGTFGAINKKKVWLQKLRLQWDCYGKLVHFKILSQV